MKQKTALSATALPTTKARWFDDLDHVLAADDLEPNTLKLAPVPSTPPTPLTVQAFFERLDHERE
jgi:hypothetical protein